MAKAVDDTILLVAQREAALAAAHKAVFDAQQLENAAQAALSDARKILEAAIADAVKQAK